MRNYSVKKYLPEDVLTAARGRISLLFDNFRKISVSISGGKDSSVLFYLALDEARLRGREIDVFFRDTEAEYAGTVETVRRHMAEEGVRPFWYQVPIERPNFSSYFSPAFYSWAEGAAWVREKDALAIHAINEPYPMHYKKFYSWFDKKSLEREPNTCFLVGLRADESLNRFRAVSKNAGALGLPWTTRNGDVVKAYPIYDWSLRDVFGYFAKENRFYNPVYDKMYALGVPLQSMRVATTIQRNAITSRNFLQEAEPETYAALVKRVEGVHTASIYGGTGQVYQAERLPTAFRTWIAYRDFILATLPQDWREKYEKIFSGKSEGNAREHVRRMLLRIVEKPLTETDEIKTKVEKWNLLL